MDDIAGGGCGDLFPEYYIAGCVWFYGDDPAELCCECSIVSTGGEGDNDSALHRRGMIAKAHGSLACERVVHSTLLWKASANHHSTALALQIAEH